MKRFCVERPVFGVKTSFGAKRNAAIGLAPSPRLHLSRILRHRRGRFQTCPYSISKSSNHFVGFACRATALSALGLRVLDGLRNGIIRCGALQIQIGDALGLMVTIGYNFYEIEVALDSALLI